MFKQIATFSLLVVLASLSIQATAFHEGTSSGGHSRSQD